MKYIKLFEEKKKNITVFLGGTCNNSTWRDELIPKLKIDYFNPVVKDWNEEAKERELKEREECDYVLYVITPKLKGFYSFCEVTDDSNKRPDKTIFCFLKEDKDDEGEPIKFDKQQLNSLIEIGNLIERNGAHWFKTISEVVQFLNNEK